ncbi:hypothetical protein ACFYPN_02730 [Streptomyces sp. NPDC005576]|uniref:nucleotidyltransferase domain-containing protein n=1 Tax=Streptomyces sp. NPDC005576 TaxID=3364726 RepID=UPI0036BED844
MTPELLLEAAGLLPDHGGYALAYGSHATGTGRPTSDLDLLYTGHSPLDDIVQAALTDNVVALHHRHGLNLDEEVPYAIKLYATHDQVDHAADLGGFRSTWGTPPPTVRETWFLSTDEFRLRLIFNVLTTPHVFLAGDYASYRRHVRSARRSTATLAAAFTTPGGPLTPRKAWEALWAAPDGRTGKDFLGYLVVPHLLSVLTQSLTQGQDALAAQMRASR